MTQEEKDLLLKDLSARLPYGVKVHTEPYGVVTLEPYHLDQFEGLHPIPYLRTMSSMTDEEREEWADLFNKPLLELEKYSDDKDAEEVAPQMFAMSHLSSINWLYSKHFNIILPKETFIEVIKENNPYEA